MRVQNKRIFISDLPETAIPDILKKYFNNYGQVVSIEIKERKELGIKNTSLFFSYINIDIDDRSLQQCFQDFANGKWFGQHISLQIAKESFLDRLKREREETGNLHQDVKVSESTGVQQTKINKPVTNGLKLEKVNKVQPKPTKENTSEESDSSSSEEEKDDILPKAVNDMEKLDIVIKSNKNKLFDKNKLKIESVGKSPIVTIEKTKKKSVGNSSEANVKRLQSLNNMKQAYKNQKSLIQQALSKIDNNPNKKIIFDDNVKVVKKKSDTSKSQSTMSLFEEYEEAQEDGFEPNFEVKEQFLGKKGQRLLELQARYRNDKRFALDARFLDEEENEAESPVDAETNGEISLENEKKKEYEILEQILGKKVLPKSQNKFDSSQKKVMIRYDPSKPEHSKYELKNEVKKEKKKKKRENSESDILNEKKREEKEAPDVSKEIFYKVTDDLKDSLKSKQEFSLLSMFGTAEEKEEKELEEPTEQCTTTVIENNFLKEKNPFRYDSSDDEDETDNIPTKNDIQTTPELNLQRTSNKTTLWTEPFFFTEDDYRLQEGKDFVEKMCIKEDGDFTKLRRDLKQIIKAKVRNNQRKNRPFKKKLGGNKKKKMLRIKKALKR